MTYAPPPNVRTYYPSSSSLTHYKQQSCVQDADLTHIDVSSTPTMYAAIPAPNVITPLHIPSSNPTLISAPPPSVRTYYPSPSQKIEYTKVLTRLNNYKHQQSCVSGSDFTCIEVSSTPTMCAAIPAPNVITPLHIPSSNPTLISAPPPNVRTYYPSSSSLTHYKQQLCGSDSVCTDISSTPTMYAAIPVQNVIRPSYILPSNPTLISAPPPTVRTYYPSPSQKTEYTKVVTRTKKRILDKDIP